MSEVRNVGRPSAEVAAYAATNRRPTSAWILEGAAHVSIASVLVRRFCVPAYLYHVLRRTSSSMFGRRVGHESSRC